MKDMEPREIEFRAWDDHNKVMKFYTLKQLADEDKFNYDTEFEAIQSGFDNWKWMQYTGLKDKNKIKIYEGDIVNCGMRMYEVAIDFNGYYLQRYKLWHGRFVPSDKFSMSLITIPSKGRFGGEAKGAEVIGNIHEHPELISKQLT